MAVELPKDAEGREIPLDTKRLYDADGVLVSIRAFRYNPNERFWRVERLDGLGTPNTTEPRLTPPDSWEKLEDDLNRCIEESDICAYYSKDKTCRNCAISNDRSGGCAPKVLEDILYRIRKLKEGE